MSESFEIPDENKNFIGMNHSSSQIIEVNFENREVAKVIFINQLAGKMSPMGQTPKDDLQIKGFKWLWDQRPKNKYDLLSPKH
jgi:hypothetical protein